MMNSIGNPLHQLSLPSSLRSQHSENASTQGWEIYQDSLNVENHVTPRNHLGNNYNSTAFDGIEKGTNAGRETIRI